MRVESAFRCRLVETNPGWWRMKSREFRDTTSTSASHFSGCTSSVMISVYTSARSAMRDIDSSSPGWVPTMMADGYDSYMEVDVPDALQLPFEQPSPFLTAPLLRELQAAGPVHRIRTAVGDD